MTGAQRAELAAMEMVRRKLLAVEEAQDEIRATRKRLKTAREELRETARVAARFLGDGGGFDELAARLKVDDEILDRIAAEWGAAL